MRAKRDSCPNCGHLLTKFRTDRRTTRHRAVELEWLICPRCRHVALKSWSFVKEAVTSGAPPHDR